MWPAGPGQTGDVERFGPEASTIGPPKEWEDVHGKAE